MIFNILRPQPQRRVVLRFLLREETPTYSIEDMLEELPQGLYLAENFEEEEDPLDMEYSEQYKKPIFVFDAVF